MKKVITTILFICLLALTIGQVPPTQDPSASAADEQYQNIQNNIDKIPIDNQGNIDQKKLEENFLFGGSKAQERINIINTWLETNTQILTFIFRIPVQISWTFLFNIYLIVVVITYSIVNAQKTWVIFESQNRARIFGTAVALLLWISNAIATIATTISSAIYYFWNTVLPYAFWISIILIILFIITMGLMAYFTPLLFSTILRVALRAVGKDVATNAVDSQVNRAKTLNADLEQSRKELKKITDEALSFSQSA